MRRVLLYRLGGEWKSKRGAFVPRFPLIHVMRAEEVSALAGDCVQRGFIEVRQVGGVAFRRSERAAYLFHRETAAGLFLETGAIPAPDQRKATQHRVLDFKR